MDTDRLSTRNQPRFAQRTLLSALTTGARFVSSRFGRRNRYAPPVRPANCGGSAAPDLQSVGRLEAVAECLDRAARHTRPAAAVSRRRPAMHPPITTWPERSVAARRPSRSLAHAAQVLTTVHGVMIRGASRARSLNGDGDSNRHGTLKR